MTEQDRIEYFKNEISRLSNQVVDLMDERDQLMSQVEQLSILCLAYEDKLPFPVMSKELFEPVFKARCLLTEIKVQTYKQGFEACINSAVKMGAIGADGEFANQLHNQAKGELNV